MQSPSAAPDPHTVFVLMGGVIWPRLLPVTILLQAFVRHSYQGLIFGHYIFPTNIGTINQL